MRIWQAYEDELVRDGAAGGLTTRQIAATLNDRTRNMVIGRMRTLRLSSAAPQGHPPKKPRAPAKPPGRPPVKPLPVPDIECDSIPVKLADAGPLACRWPLWDVSGYPDYLVCGAPGYPWCVRHRRVLRPGPQPTNCPGQ